MSDRVVVGAGLLASAALAGAGHAIYRTSSPLGDVVSYVVAPLCVVALLASWWLLRDRSVRTVLTAAAAWSAPLLVVPPLYSRDLYAYAGQAHLVLVGLDPYTNGPEDAFGPLSAQVDPVWADAPSPYGPVFLRLAARVVSLTGQRPQFAVIGLRLLAVAGMALLAWGLVRLARSHGTSAGRAAWLGVANPLVLLHGVAGGHNDLLMAGLMVLGLSFAGTSVAGSAALIAGAALVKAPALLTLAFVPLLAGGWRLSRVAVTAGVAGLVALALTVLTGLGWGWTSTLGNGEAPGSLLSLTTGVGAVVGNESAAHAVGLALGGVLVLLLLWRATPQTALLSLGSALLAVVLLAPVIQPWYVLWGLVVIAPVATRRVALGLGAASAVLCLLILPSGRHLIRPPLYGVPLVLVAAAGMAVAARGRTGLPKAAAGR